MSQALVDLEMSHEEFKTIVNEKEKYWKTTEYIRDIQSNDELNEEVKKVEKYKKIRECII